MLTKSEFFTKFTTILPGSNNSSSSIYFTPMSMDSLEEMHGYSVKRRFYEFFEFAPFQDIKDTKKYIEMLLDRMAGDENSRSSTYWFVRRTSDDKLLGSAGFVNLDFDRKSIEWGYGVDPDLWGHGYILKIQEALKAYAFEILGLNRLYGITMINNFRTIESVLASGAKHEGTIRDYYCKNDEFIDGWQYSILAKDYFVEGYTKSNNLKITEESVITILADLLLHDDININSAMENTPSWDSLTHMNIIVELKQRFLVDFSPLDISDATSVKSIVKLLNR